MVKLILVFLGHDVPGFRFNQPGAHHSARWLADCLYHLKITMTSNYTDYDEDIMKQIILATEYIVLFHAKFYLQGSIGAIAASNDLKAFKIALKIKDDEEFDRYKTIATSLHTSLDRHKWYLVPQLVLLSIADDDLENDIKHHLLARLMTFECPDEFDKEIAQPIKEIDSDTILVDLINEQSYLLFLSYSWNLEAIQDLAKSDLCLGDPLYDKFREQVANLQVTNVMAERNIALVAAFIKKNHSEEKLQDALIVVKKNRADFPKNLTKEHFK